MLVVGASVYVERMQISRAEPDLLGQRAIGLGIAVFGLVGALLLYRRPGHRLGWLLAGIGVLALIGGSANEYVLAATRAGLANDFVGWLVWWSNWFWFPVVGGVIVFLPLLFPDGQPPTGRWRWVAVLGAVAILGMVVASSIVEDLEATILGDIPQIKNPLGIEGLTSVEVTLLYETSAWLLLAAFVGAVVSMWVRFRRSQREARLQLKWFSYAVGLMLAWVLLGEVIWQDVLGQDALLGGSLLPFGLLLTFIPVTIAVAILRYRLYAIDRIVSRTVSYGLVVALLALVYTSGVFVVGSILPGDQTDLAVAGSTLAVAGLFAPLRLRIQRIVDRRFNRSRYDAEREIERFAGGLKNQLDLGRVAADLRSVLERTIQPVTAEIWLRSRP